MKIIIIENATKSVEVKEMTQEEWQRVRLSYDGEVEYGANGDFESDEIPHPNPDNIRGFLLPDEERSKIRGAIRLGRDSRVDAHARRLRKTIKWDRLEI